MNESERFNWRLRKNIRRIENAAYAASHSEEESKRHFTVRRYASGRWSHGGANRSSSLRREIRLKVTKVEICLICDGVTFESSIYPLCACGPFRLT